MSSKMLRNVVKCYQKVYRHVPLPALMGAPRVFPDPAIQMENHPRPAWRIPLASMYGVEPLCPSSVPESSSSPAFCHRLDGWTGRMGKIFTFRLLFFFPAKE
jgi:hypothetical protein